MTNINKNQNRIHIIQNTSRTDFQEKNKSIDDLLSTLQINMQNRCENEIPEYGDFAPIKEKIANEDKNVYAGNISLICEPSEDNPTKRYLNYHQMNPQNGKGLMCQIASGTKEDILEALNDKNIVDILKQNSERMSEKMQFMKW